MRKALRKATKYEKRAVGGWTPSLASMDAEAMLGFFSSAGHVLAPRVFSVGHTVLGWVLGKRH